ncbi:MAG TPA: LuxR C-terminal-related transcriptional regulator [Puia sp.]|nr:LuxR C-terminal-related transcriptional regulator [Puia sp.]
MEEFKHEEEQARLQYLHQLEMDQKNKELALITMHLLQRSNLLSGIREELLAVIKKLNIPGLPYELRNVFKMLGDPEKNDNDWQHFTLYFDQVHNNFLSVLKSKYPLLSATDLKLCAYLRLNLSSKEIAQMLNISLKGVEVSRYRIRKKLSLPTEVNLYEFLLTITPPPSAGPPLSQPDTPAPEKGSP